MAGAGAALGAAGLAVVCGLEVELDWADAFAGLVEAVVCAASDEAETAANATPARRAEQIRRADCDNTLSSRRAAVNVPYSIITTPMFSTDNGDPATDRPHPLSPTISLDGVGWSLDNR